MARYLKRLATPRIVLFVVAVLLLIYVAYDERQTEYIAGCWDCGWETRQAFYVVLAVAGLLMARWWAYAVSLLLGLKVLYTIGRMTFWNNTGETNGAWRIVKSSLTWSSETHLEFFVLLAMATVVICYASLLLRRSVSN